MSMPVANLSGHAFAPGGEARPSERASTRRLFRRPAPARVPPDSGEGRPGVAVADGPAVVPSLPAWLALPAQFMAFGAIYLLAFYIRCDGAVPASLWASATLGWPMIAAIKTGVFVSRGCHRSVGRTLTAGDFARRLEAVVIGSSALILLSVCRRGLWPAPASVLVVDGGLTLAWLILGGGGARTLAGRYAKTISSTPARRVLVVGAGAASEAVVQQVENDHELNLKVVGVLGPDDASVGRTLAGAKIVGRTDDLESIAARCRAEEVLIPSPAVSAREIREITDACKEAGLRSRVVPAFDALMAGRVSVGPGRVDVLDILRRDPVVLDTDLIRGDVEGRCVLISGAAGSIGSEICRQILAFRPARLVLLDHSENGLFHLERELRRDAARGARIVPVVASIRDEARLDSVLSRYRPDIVIHAAAHKHVPMMEANPGEAVKNNVFGTKTLVDQSLSHGVCSFVMVSTDKAVNPTSVMGACKRLAESYVQALSRETRSRLVTVRFGNVMGSIGSVVPIFIDQVRRGGPVCVTHPEMTRYFMTIPEAAQLVLQAGAQGCGGEIFILDMGKPLRILDVARSVIRLSGYVEGRDVEIAYTGLRPGEKLHEELHDVGEEPLPTSHPMIRIARHRPLDAQTVRSGIERLSGMVDGPPESLIEALVDLVPGYRGVQRADAVSA